MSSCIICGRDVDGRICSSHQEDVVFEFRGDDPNQLVQNRFYRGVVDGYAEFGVFVDLSSKVTGLLHRSELDRRLESLDWEAGDSVFVQVKNIRQNGNVDLTWSIRQSDREFRGVLVQDGHREYELDELDEESTAQEDEAGNGSSSAPDEGADAAASADENVAAASPDEDVAAASPDEDVATAEAVTRGGEEAAASDAAPTADTDVAGDASPTAGTDDASDADTTGDADTTDASRDDDATDASHADNVTDAIEETARRSDAADESPFEAKEPEPQASTTRREIGSLSDRVGELVRIEGEVVGARQTGGPTVFELRDETGVVDCAAFVEAGVRAYPDVEVGDVVRLDGEVELRRNEIQVETEALVELEGEEADAVRQRLADAMTAKARPDGVEPLVDHEPVSAVEEPLLDAAEAIRRAVLESRPIVLRHGATADGYVAGAAIERAVLPLIREEHAKSDAEYHYFDRRPLDDAVYSMDAATNDVTRMLQDRDRHDEKLPLVVLVGTGSTVESEDGLGMLGLYGAERVVVDAETADPEIDETADVLVNPGAANGDADDLTTGALAANLAAAINADVREDVSHLPAVSYWRDAPEGYADLAGEVGYDADAVRELREAVALEAYYQSYEDKRELITDLLFGESEAAVAVAGSAGDVETETLASHVAAQFREKLDTEVETAEANMETTSADGVSVTVLDADSFTHRYDFPPTPLLLDELHRRSDAEDDHVTVGVAMDELWVRSSERLDVRAVAADAAEREPEAGITANGVREGRIEFLSGARDAVQEAVIDAVAAQFD